MSDQAPEVVELPREGDAAFTVLMDTLAPEPEGAPAASADGAGDPPAADAGGAAGGSEGAAAGAGTEGATATGGASGDQSADGGATAGGAQAGSDAADAGQAGDQAAADGTGGDGTNASGGAADRPSSWTSSAAELIPKLGELATQFETRTQEAYQQAALEEVRAEHPKYFEALEMHPRLLVGKQVPAIDGEGFETLRDSEDAKEWQDAVKSLLVAEVRSKASKAMDENKDFLTTIHASIELFQNNADLIPGTKDFDVELANRFTSLVKPYELRVEGKLQGYSIPVQPIIDQLRQQITQERAAAKAKPSTNGAAAQPPAAAPPPPPTPEPPQAGIPSKAGAGADSEDFSVLFGTIGLPNLRI